MSAAITGWGMAVPERAVTNAELAALVPGIDEEWIVRRTGIRERRIASPGETTASLSAAAALRALARASLSPGDIDLIVLGTCTPDQQIPATAPIVQAAIGATNAGAFDVNAACAGFMTALASADALITAGRAGRALVIGAEVLSRFVDWTDPKSCVLFGDGAGAVVLEASSSSAGLMSLTMGAAGDAAPLIHVPAGGSARPASAETVAAAEHTIRMNGPEVYRAAVRIMSEAGLQAMAAARVSDVDLLIAHQANQRIIAEVGTRLGLPEDCVFSNVARYGNTSAASVPIAICEAADAGQLVPGSRLLLSAVGAGLAWAAGLVRWTGTEQPAAETAGRVVGANA